MEPSSKNQSERPSASGEPDPSVIERGAVDTSTTDFPDDATDVGDGASAQARRPAVQDSSAASQPERRADAPGPPFDEKAAAAQTPASSAEDGAPPSTPESLTLADLSETTLSEVDARRVTMLNDVNLRVRIELGRTRMLVEDVLKLGEGSVVELDKLAGDPVDVFVNNRLIARGEVLVLNDNFCVRVNEVLSHDPHRVSV